MRQQIYSPKGSYFAFEPNNSSLDEECLPDIRTGIYDGRSSKKISLPNMALGAATMMLLMAVAVTVQCDGCIVVHTEAALKNGAKEQEILEALGVAVNVKAGSALIYSTRALDAVRANTAGSGTPEEKCFLFIMLGRAILNGRGCRCRRQAQPIADSRDRC